MLTIVANPTRLRLAARHSMLAHARAAAARESCGVLLGRQDDGGGRLIEAAVPVVNHAPAATHAYMIPARRIREIEWDARARGLDVVGFFHSHPDGSIAPSATDLAHAWPWYTYVIVPLGPGSNPPTAWRLRPDRTGFDPEAVEWLA